MSAIDRNSPLWHRHYMVPPGEKTADHCKTHGQDHRAYGWSPQFDPRWNQEQIAAYWSGYYGEGQ